MRGTKTPSFFMCQGMEIYLVQGKQKYLDNTVIK